MSNPTLHLFLLVVFKNTGVILYQILLASFFLASFFRIGCVCVRSLLHNRLHSRLRLRTTRHQITRGGAPGLGVLNPPLTFFCLYFFFYTHLVPRLLEQQAELVASELRLVTRRRSSLQVRPTPRACGRCSCRLNVHVNNRRQTLTCVELDGTTGVSGRGAFGNQRGDVRGLAKFALSRLQASRLLLRIRQHGAVVGPHIITDHLITPQLLAVFVGPDDEGR